MPNTHHVHCVRHILANMRKRKDISVSPPLTAKVWQAQQARTQALFDTRIQDIEDICAPAAQYLSNIPPEEWALWKFNELGMKVYSRYAYTQT